jgi:hypothetical protein
MIDGILDPREVEQVDMFDMIPRFCELASKTAAKHHISPGRFGSGILARSGDRS